MKQSFVYQLADRYVHSVIAVWPLLLTAVGVALALVVLGRLGLLERVTGWRKGVVLALASAGALWWAWQLRWLCDDAYISFRYADNWARGLGPVFNAGETGGGVHQLSLDGPAGRADQAGGAPRASLAGDQPRLLRRAPCCCSIGWRCR